MTFSAATDEDVQSTFSTWQGMAQVLQQPVHMDFGYTFVVADPDGHRLRVFARAADPK